MKKYLLLFAIMLLVTALLLVFKDRLTEMGLNIDFVMAANFLLFLITAAALAIVSRLAKANIHRFMSGVYGSFLIKLFVLAGGLLIYGLLVDDINKPGVFVALGLYALYTAVEVEQLMKIIRKK